MIFWERFTGGREILGAVPILPASFPTQWDEHCPRVGQGCISFLLVLSSLISPLSLCAFCAVDMVTLATALEIFNEHDLQPSERAMDVVEVIHCLTALYERLEEERGILVNVPLCVDMSLNWLLNVFDRCLSLAVPRAVGLPRVEEPPALQEGSGCC